MIYTEAKLHFYKNYCKQEGLDHRDDRNKVAFENIVCKNKQKDKILDMKAKIIGDKIMTKIFWSSRRSHYSNPLEIQSWR